jgi:hypothetical protein
MTKSTQSRYSTGVDVSFPDFPTFNTPIRQFKLIQEAGNHDVIELHFGTFNSFYLKRLKTGVAVRVSWKNSKGTGDFYGYVYHVVNTTQATLVRNVIVTCVGASFVLKEGGSKNWLNKTASEIVTDIAKTFKLKPVVTQHPVRFSHQSLVGHTYWEKIQELAQRIGYVAQVIGVELHFHPMDIMIDKNALSIPVLSHHDSIIGFDGAYEAHTLDMFKPKIGDHVEVGGHNRKNKTVTGINHVTGKVFSATSSPNQVGVNLRYTTKDALFSEIIPTHITDTATAAKATADAHAQLARWSIPAIGAGQGDPRIVPYATVEINGTGDTTDGFWIIKKVEHTAFFDGRYNVEFSCVTDGIGGNKPTAFRTSSATIFPTRNIAFELSQQNTNKLTSVKLTAQVPLVRETEAEFLKTPRRWVGM